MHYNTKNKTVDQVIKETRKIIAKYKVKPEGKLFYVKKYQDCTSIIESKKTGKLYVNCLFNIYGPFKDFETCLQFRKILNIENNALRQAEVNAWSREGTGFLRSEIERI